MLLILAGAAAVAGQGRSKWVSVDNAQKLRYGTDARGNRIMDFSHAGYKGGGVALPRVRTVNTLAPLAGDNTSRIQAALDEVAHRPRGADGFRGAVLLRPGTYDVVGTLRIAASGVVLRGSGSAAIGTIIHVSGPPHRFLDIGGSGSWRPEGEPALVTDSYVPSGADQVQVDAASRFKIGDAILIRRPVTEAWIRFMGMDTLSRDRKPQIWIKPGTFIDTDRAIRAISGNRLTLDVPLSDSFDAAYLNPPGTSVVKYAFPDRIEQVGFESMRVAVPPRDVPITEGQYTLLRMNAVSDGWVRDVAVEDTQNTITLGPTARRITLEEVHIRHTLPFSGAASPADIAISGTQVLVHRSSVSGKRVWPVVTQAGVTGPNVILNFKSDEAGVAPHQRWATGLLVDSSEFLNGTDRRPNIAFSNREYAGSGHGWSVGWAVAWNVTADYVLIQQPPGAMNWCIGCSGRPAPVLWHGNPIPIPEIPSDTFESPWIRVSPSSLYLAQLRERLGQRAVRNIGYQGRSCLINENPSRNPRSSQSSRRFPLENGGNTTPAARLLRPAASRSGIGRRVRVEVAQHELQRGEEVSDDLGRHKGLRHVAQRVVEHTPLAVAANPRNRINIVGTLVAVPRSRLDLRIVEVDCQQDAHLVPAQASTSFMLEAVVFLAER